jgi:competence protein ComEA
MQPAPTNPKTTVDPVARRVASFQLALSFLLGVAATLGGVKLYHARTSQPLDQHLSDHYRIDLNRASVQDLRQLPRISTAMAERIVAARPIENVDDLRKVGGLGPKSVEKLKPHLTMSDVGSTLSAKPIAGEIVDPNSATLEQLKMLPGIGPKMAQRIIDEREKRPFANVDELRRVSGIGPKTLEKLRPLVEIR